MKRFLYCTLVAAILLIAACSGNPAATPIAPGSTEIPASEIQSPAESTPTTENQTGDVQLNTDFENAVPVEMQLFLGMLKLNNSDFALTREQANTLLPLAQEFLSILDTQESARPVPSQADTPSDDALQPPVMPTEDPDVQAQMDEVISQMLTVLTVEQIQAISELQITAEKALAIQRETGIGMGGPGEDNADGSQPSQGPGGQPPQGQMPGDAPEMGSDGNQPPAQPGQMGPSDGTSDQQPPSMPTDQDGMPGGGSRMNLRLVNAVIDYLQKVSNGETVNFSESDGSTGMSQNNGLSDTASAIYLLDGVTDVQNGLTYEAASADQSAIWVTNGGNFTLLNATITSSGASSSSDNSSFYGLNAVVLANAGSHVEISNSRISSSGDGANGVFAESSGTEVILRDTTIDATGQYAHGVMATNGGKLTLSNVDLTTSGANSGVIATDRGGGTIVMKGGTIAASGQDSPGIYSTGLIQVSDTDVASSGAEVAVIEGANSIELSNATLASSKEDKWGVLIYQSMSGDAEGSEGKFTMSGGSLSNTAVSGPLFYVTNTTGIVSLQNVDVLAQSGVLMNAASGKWGNDQTNGGHVELIGDHQTLQGDCIVDAISSLALDLRNTSTFVGAINSQNSTANVTVTLDGTSVWTVTADSYLGKLADSAGISGMSITNIQGNGFTVFYDATLNPELNNQVYNLSGGGYLKPAD